MATDTRPPAEPTADSGRPDEALLPLLDGRACSLGHSLRLLDPERDADWLHDWLSQDYTRFWGMNQHSRQQIADFYRELQASGHSHAYLGQREGQPVFLLEHYLPACAEIGHYYPVRPGDHGMHFALAPCQQRIHNFSLHALLAIVEILFRDTKARRIVVEPDTCNLKIHPLNFRAGFHYSRILKLPSKTAYLGFCTRRQFAAAQRRLRSLS